MMQTLHVPTCLPTSPTLWKLHQQCMHALKFQAFAGECHGSPARHDDHYNGQELGNSVRCCNISTDLETSRGVKWSCNSG